MFVFLLLYRPGFTRLNLPFFFSDEVTNFVLEAIDDVATNGWKMLPQVNFYYQHRGTISLLLVNGW